MPSARWSPAGCRTARGLRLRRAVPDHYSLLRTIEDMTEPSAVPYLGTRRHRPGRPAQGVQPLQHRRRRRLLTPVRPHPSARSATSPSWAYTIVRNGSEQRSGGEVALGHHPQLGRLPCGHRRVPGERVARARVEGAGLAEELTGSQRRHPPPAPADLDAAAQDEEELGRDGALLDADLAGREAAPEQSLVDRSALIGLQHGQQRVIQHHAIVSALAAARCRVDPWPARSRTPQPSSRRRRRFRPREPAARPGRRRRPSGRARVVGRSRLRRRRLAPLR